MPPDPDDPRGADGGVGDGTSELTPDDLAQIATSPRVSFVPGGIIAGRYRIIRYVARGGMGEVYEVEDLTLRGRLALKTIRPDIAQSRVALERFKREISIARRITHPNVSRIYDIGVHRGPPDTMFLTMEFLAGDTLQARLVRNGRMAEREALPLVEQIAAGLAAAHDAGVIHRDFKSANVMLVPGAGQAVRAVVTDFGLARPASSEEGMATLSEAGAVVGTPAYMAPEQVEGRKLTPAADIFAFGIVLYEMVIGRRPFEGDTPLSLAVKRLMEAPTPPLALLPTLDPTWNAVILHCLARDPAARFQSAKDVVQALRSADTPTAFQLATPQPIVARRSRMRARLIVGAAALTAAAVLAAMWLPVRSKPVAVSPAVQAQKTSTVSLRRSVAILGLDNNSGATGSTWLSTAISEMLATELSAAGSVRVASGQEVERVKLDLGLADGRPISPESLQRAASLLNVDTLLSGSYTVVGDAGSRLLRIDVRLIDPRTGTTGASMATSGTESQLFDLIARVGGGLRQKLGLPALAANEAVEVQAAIPSNPEAVRLYTEGLAKLRRLDAEGARDLLVRALAADEKHPMILSALSAAYAALGQDARATDTAARAVALSTKLSREQRMLIEARFHEASKQWEKAVEVQRSLWESFPDNLEYGVNLANSQISAGQSKEALVTIGGLRKLPSLLSADPRIDLVEARAYQEIGDFDREKAFAQTAAAKARRSGARVLLARARMLEGTALMTLGKLGDAAAAVDEARGLLQAAGDRGGVARALEQTAGILDKQGDLEGVRRLLEQALVIHNAIGEENGVARVQLNVGTVLVSQGRPAEAQKYFDRALATFRKVGAKYAAAVALNDIGMMMFNTGDLLAAQKRYQESLTIFGELGEKSGTATALTNIAEVLACRGDLEQARAMHSDALAMNRAIGDKSGIAYDLYRLAEIFAMKGDLIAAVSRYQEALALQREIGDRLSAAETQAALAAVLVEQGKAVEAERAGREAEEILRAEGADERSSFALAVVAESLLLQGKRKEANEAAQRAWAAASASEDRRLRFSVGITHARARAASGAQAEVDAALKMLEQLRAEAVRSLFVPSELDARLAAGEIELAAGRATGKRRLAAVAKDAMARGFVRIARRASAVT